MKTQLANKILNCEEMYNLLKEISKKNDTYTDMESEHGTHESFEAFSGDMFERIDKVLLGINK